MQTLLLLAGKSRRFWPLSEKALWPFLGKPLLKHQVERMSEGGLTKITFVGGKHNIEEVNTFFPAVPTIEQEEKKNGMRGALLSALTEIQSGPVCIVSSNDVIDPEGYRVLLEASRTPGVDGALLAQRVKRYFPGGYLVTSSGEEKNANPRVAGVVEKPAEGKEPSDLVNIVAHIHNHPEKLIDALEEISSDRDDAYEVALTKLCKELNFVAVPYVGRWDAVKYPWDVLDLAQRFLATLSEQSLEGAEIHHSAVIEGPVTLGKGVRVLPHATVIGPCHIGEGTIIGTNALVRASMIGAQCVIGFGSEVARSHLHSYVWTHSTYIGDSVIGHNVAFGAGSVVANFRLDEGEIVSAVGDPLTKKTSASESEKISTQRTKFGVVIGDHVRIGVQSGFAPGVKIGRNSFVSSASFVSRDVGEGRYVVVKEGVLEERENTSEAPPKRS